MARPTCRVRVPSRCRAPTRPTTRRALPASGAEPTPPGPAGPGGVALLGTDAAAPTGCLQGFPAFSFLDCFSRPDSSSSWAGQPPRRLLLGRRADLRRVRSVQTAVGSAPTAIPDLVVTVVEKIQGESEVIRTFHRERPGP